jgi:hypothetical protein
MGWELLEDKVDAPNLLMILNIHLYLSGMWLGINLRTDIRKHMCWKEIKLRVQNLSSILDTIVNIKGGL